MATQTFSIPASDTHAQKQADVARLVKYATDYAFMDIGQFWTAAKLQDLQEYLTIALSTNCYDFMVLTNDAATIARYSPFTSFPEFKLGKDGRKLVVYINPDFLNTL
jgi:hypothetical protein